MVCDGKTCHGFGCPNFYINEGKVGCLEHHATSSFKASNGNLNSSEEDMQQQLDEIKSLFKKYQELNVAPRKAKVDALVARIDAVIASMKEQMNFDEEESAAAAKRRQLIMTHPWGYLENLPWGPHFSMGALEAMEKASPPSEFDSFEEMEQYYNSFHSNSLLANSAKMAAFRAAMSKHHDR